MKPPYGRATVATVTQDAVAKAVHTYDFAASDLEFSDWGKLIAHLQSELLKSKRDSAASPEDLGVAVATIMGFAPLETVKHSLARIEKELLPAGQWQAAFTLLRGLRTSHVVQTNEQLCSEIAELLDKCGLQAIKNAGVKLEAAKAEEDLSTYFPNATEAYGECVIERLTSEIRERKQVFAVGAR
jgi:hypothetical protein